MNEQSLDHDIAYQDILFSIIGVLLVCLVAMAKFMSDTAAKAGDGSKAPGAVMIELVWPNTNRSDVDLWVQAPGDVPVGYSNKGGAVFNLLRDDLGSYADLLEMNYENSYSRGIVPGEYTVNVHLYRLIGALPLECKLIVTTKDGDTPAHEILATTATFMKEGQERTAVRFALDENGNLVPGSVHKNFKPLWHKK